MSNPPNTTVSSAQQPISPRPLKKAFSPKRPITPSTPTNLTPTTPSKAATTSVGSIPSATVPSDSVAAVIQGVSQPTTKPTIESTSPSRVSNNEKQQPSTPSKPSTSALQGKSIESKPNSSSFNKNSEAQSNSQTSTHSNASSSSRSPSQSNVKHSLKSSPSVSGKRKRASTDPATASHDSLHGSLKNEVARNRSDKLSNVLGGATSMAPSSVSNTSSTPSNSTASTETKRRKSKKIIDDEEEEESFEPAQKKKSTTHEDKTGDSYSAIRSAITHKDKEVRHHQRKTNSIKKHFISVDKPELSETSFPDSDLQPESSIVLFSQEMYLKTIYQIIKERKKF
ncbi:hypothetical protein FDP41_011228 [Naegleria fowleri]|uniref:Uncharacterized protein n=1 Tax=Naegleria fowleri TaxID=5763 RepID=A0A6A5C9A7_NAEFO|nr:uncharacterized protein FDP41_011228 [Naegleria fowleri]KAF0982298.1 hypothetical protein FDP41_011228 [Naegleria fowleri]CAG4711134.1 unnamed protein product [Naegleria fowleri]